MADYGVNIAVAVKNTQAITQLSGKIKETGLRVNQLNNLIENFANITGTTVVNSVGNFNSKLRDAAKNLDDVALGTKAAIEAARDFARAQDLANDALREQAQLLAKVRNEGRSGTLRGGTQFSGPIGPGQASPTALSSPLPPRVPTALRSPMRPQSLLPQFGITAKAGNIASDMEEVYASILRLTEKANQEEAQKLQTLRQGTKEVEALAQKYRTVNETRKTGKALQLQIRRGIVETRREAGREAEVYSRDYLNRLKTVKEIGKERRDQMNLADREVATERKINAILERRAQRAEKTAERNQRLRSASSSALIGGAFPLLFGQGAGASIGGAVGGFGGGMIGGEFGFGLSLIGTQIGAMVDQLISQSADLGNALQPATANLEAIIAATGIANTEFSTLIGELEEAENSSAALALATSELTRLVGQDGVEALKEFGADTTELSNDFSRAMTIMMAAVAGLINSSNVLKGIIGAVENKVLDAQIRRTILDGGPQAEKLRATFTKRAPTMAEKSAGREPTTKFDRPTEATRNLMRQINEESFKVSMNAGKAALKTKEKLDFHSAESVILRKQLQISEIDGDLTNDKVYKLSREIIFQEARLELEKEGSVELNVQNKRQTKLNKLLSKRNALIEKNENTSKGGGKRSDAEQKRIEKRIARLNIESEALRQRVEIEDRITQAKINQDDETVIRLQNEQKILSLTERMKKQLEGARTEQEKIAILQKTSAEIAFQTNRAANELKLLEAGRNENYKDLIEQLDHELLLRAATTEEARMQLEIDREIAKIKKDDPDRDTTDIRKKLEVLKSPKRGQELIDEETGRLQDELDLLTDKGFQVVQAAGAIGDAFSESFKGVINGSMTAQEALANLFQRTADHFLDMTAQIIAAAIKMQAIQFISQIVSSMASTAATTPPSTMPGGASQTGLGLNINGVDQGISPFGPGSVAVASGGYISSPTRALVGEGGQGEYVIPESKMRESMTRYSRGARGSSVIPEAGGSGTSGDGGVAVAAPIDVRYTVERINSVDYVTADQFQSGMQSAAAQGAQRGEQNTLKRLQMSGSTRRRLGM